MAKRKFQFIAGEKRLKGHSFILNGIYKIYQNEQVFGQEFKNQKFIIKEILENGFLITGYGYGELIKDAEDDESKALQHYGNGPFFIKKEDFKTKG